MVTCIIIFLSTDTTDIQNIKVMLNLPSDARKIIVHCQCDLIIGSNAEDCKLVLVSGSYNDIISVPRHNNSVTSVVERFYLDYHPFCKGLNETVKVMAYDFMEGGVDHRLKVPGNVVWSSDSKNNLQKLCKSISRTFKLSWSIIYYNSHCSCIIYCKVTVFVLILCILYLIPIRIK